MSFAVAAVSLGKHMPRAPEIATWQVNWSSG